MPNDSDIQKRPKITFPCDYPIKIIGDNAPDFKDFVLHSLEQHSNKKDILEVTVKDSRNSNFLSVTVKLNAQSETQLSNIFQTLKASRRVKMVL